MLKKNKFLYITIFYTLCLPIQIQANWHKVHEDGFFSLYIDKHNVKFFGDSRKIMELQNLSKVNYKGELSYRYISEYDCGSKKWRIIYEERFADRMASGKLLSRSASFDEWNEIPKNTAAEKVFSFICWKEYFLTEIGIVTKLKKELQASKILLAISALASGSFSYLVTEPGHTAVLITLCVMMGILSR